jgi:flagellar motility protein MotE (MotC chaperone)
MRFRLLPVLIFVAAAMLTLKVGSIWQGISSLRDGGEWQQSVAVAQEPAKAAAEKNQQGAAQPASPDASRGDAASAPPGLTEDPKQGAAPKEKMASARPIDPRQLSNSEIKLLQALAQRRTTLDYREESLNQREALLRAAEQKLVDRQTELLAMRSEVKGLLDNLDAKEKRRIGNLVKIYENMKPKGAAVIFNELELPVLMSVVERMKVRKLAPVIAAMNPEKARKITRTMAKRQKTATPGPAANNR